MGFFSWFARCDQCGCRLGNTKYVLSKGLFGKRQTLCAPCYARAS